MKNALKTTLLAFILVIPGILLAQLNPLDSYIEKYEGISGFYYIDMKTNMFNVDEKEVGSQKHSNNVIDFKVVSFEKNEKSTFDPANIYNNFKNTLNDNIYKGLIDVRHSGKNVEMLVKKQGDQITEIIIIVQEKDETTLIVATGNFDLKDISKLSELKNCKGLQTLEKLCEN